MIADQIRWHKVVLPVLIIAITNLHVRACAVQYYLGMMLTVPWRCLVNSENRAADSQSDLRIF